MLKMYPTKLEILDENNFTLAQFQAVDSESFNVTIDATVDPQELHMIAIFLEKATIQLNKGEQLFSETLL